MKTITATLRRNYVYQGRTYGPGEVAIPVGLATALGISADGEQEVPASAPGALGTPGGDPVDYASLTKAELEEAAAARGLTVEGSGAGGSVLKTDLVDALAAADGGAR